MVITDWAVVITCYEWNRPCLIYLLGADFECTEEGFYPNPKDCKKYFWCLESGAAGIVSHIFTCPSGDDALY